MVGKKNHGCPYGINKVCDFDFLFFMLGNIFNNFIFYSNN